MSTPPPNDPTVAPPRPRKVRRPLRPWHYLLIGAAIPILLLLGFVLLLPLLMGAMLGGNQGSDVGQHEYVVTRMDAAASVTLPGTIEPTQRLDLSFASPGEVNQVTVSVGDPVTPGTVLATIDDTELSAAVTDARAETNAAWQDYQDARKSGSSAAVSAMRSAHALKAQALKEAESALEKAALTSTIDGVVAAVNIQQGELAGSGGAAMGPDAGTGGGQADIVVISRSFQVATSVGGAERGRLAKDMQAIVTTSSTPEPLRGTVTSLGVVAETAPDTGNGRPGGASFPLVVTLEGQPADVYAGAAATIEVLAEQGEQSLMIPVEALFDRMSESQGTVMVKHGEESTTRDVTLGSENGPMIAVTSGLDEGDVIVYFGPVAMVAGAAVEEGAAVEVTEE
ncbi:MAG: biotin/lipoyl-binding protein, partial [Propionibacteriaceae bacterium]|nr:biotin/lipoyl-binding protein [Propionibacteriaceae bacterium]